MWTMLCTVVTGLITVKYGIRPAKGACTPKFFRPDVDTSTCFSLSKTLEVGGGHWSKLQYYTKTIVTKTKYAHTLNRHDELLESFWRYRNANLR